MAKNRNHFFSLAILAPTQVIVHIFRTETQFLCGFQNMVKTLPDLRTVGSIGRGRALDTGDA